MGYGDEIMGLGLAARIRTNKPIGFGDGRSVFWSMQAKEVFYGHSELVRPGHEKDFDDIVWINHFRGNRLYHKAITRERFIYNETFSVHPAKLFFRIEDDVYTRQIADEKTIVIEPNVKDVAPNKQWPKDRYQKVANALADKGYSILQLVYPSADFLLKGARILQTPRFMAAASALRKAVLYIGPEGGLHHAAACLDVPAVVIFGGYVSPLTTGYGRIHSNLFTGNVACGSRTVCDHCKRAMNDITVEMVLSESFKRLSLRSVA